MEKLIAFEVFDIDRSTEPVTKIPRLTLFSDGTVEGDLLKDLFYVNYVSPILRTLEAQISEVKSMATDAKTILNSMALGMWFEGLPKTSQPISGVEFRNTCDKCGDVLIRTMTNPDAAQQALPLVNDWKLRHYQGKCETEYPR